MESDIDSDFNSIRKNKSDIENSNKLGFRSFANIGFIGFGLIGGSIAKALRKSNPASYLVAYDHHNQQASPDLQAALDDGVLDLVSASLEEVFPDCDLIFLCAPVLTNIKYLKLLKPIIKQECILTDVGSVKGNIHQAVQELNLNMQFIGGHPMTGSEKTGYLNSQALLLENAYYILTPTLETPEDAIIALVHLVKGLGALPLLLDYSEHDEITAAISHVPHIIAAQLVNLVRDADGETEKMRSLAAGGFKDITRIASSSPLMWQNICLTNSGCIKRLLDRYIEYLKEASEALTLQDENYLYRIFDTAGEYRSAIPNKAIGLIKKLFEIHLDIKDEAGAIATIATLLAANQISIKNIGIVHNREFEEGVLKIEFYEEQAQEKAIDMLTRYNYRIYERK